jgi:hypothetical protein
LFIAIAVVILINILSIVVFSGYFCLCVDFLLLIVRNFFGVFFCLSALYILKSSKVFSGSEKIILAITAIATHDNKEKGCLRFTKGLLTWMPE